MKPRLLHYDAVVVGAGVHGLVAGTRLAQAGAKVCVIARGHGATHLSPATIDRPPAPEIALWFKQLVASGPLPGYEYVDVPDGLGLPTALGTRKPTVLVPSTMAPGTRTVSRIAVVGSPGLRDFQAGLCAANLKAERCHVRAVQFDWRLDRADANAVHAAARFDDPVWRQQFIKTLSPLLEREDQLIGLPAVLGLRHPGGIHAELQERLGRPVFEIPTLPPSVAGMRLFEILRTALRTAGGRLVLGPHVELGTTGGNRIRSVRAGSAGTDTWYSADAFVLAEGEDAATEEQALTRGYRAVEVLT